MSEEEPRRFIYGRRHGPKLKPGQRRRLETRLPDWAVTLPAGGGRLDPGRVLAPGTHELWLELGFGAGEHLAWQAQAAPDVTHLGVEPYPNGVAALLARIDGLGLRNVRIVVDDARLVLRALPAGSIARIHVLFPDPWPKLRHHKRRLVNRATLADMARLLVPGGELRLASDDAGYVTWMLEALQAEPRLRWTARRATDWRERPPDWPPTRYEAKAREAGRRCVFLRVRREENGTAPT